MGIYHNPFVFLVDIGEHYVGRFPTDPWKFNELAHFVGYDPVILTNYELRTLLDILGFIAVEPR